MCNTPNVTSEEILDPLGLTRGGDYAPGAKEFLDPGGITQALITGDAPRGYDPGNISEGWQDLSGQTARDAAAEQQAEFEREQVLAEEERRKAAEQFARGYVGPSRGRASTILTSPSGILSDGTTARRTLMAG